MRRLHYAPTDRLLIRKFVSGLDADLQEAMIGGWDVFSTANHLPYDEMHSYPTLEMAYEYAKQRLLHCTTEKTYYTSS